MDRRLGTHVRLRRSLDSGEPARVVRLTIVVRTQDADHPIYLAAYMTGNGGGYFGSPSFAGHGDPEFVNVVPTGQWLNSYSFYADPTDEETSLVIVRQKHQGKFEDVWAHRKLVTSPIIPVQ